MNTTTLTTILGLVMAGGMALAMYLQTQGNLTRPPVLDRPGDPCCHRP
jgi:hypothetical protein